MNRGGRVRRMAILGAGGRDYHVFLTLYRDDPAVEVVAFTAAQIPYLAGRTFPASLAGPRYPRGIPIVDESELPRLVAEEGVDRAIFAYSDVSHAFVEEKRREVESLGAEFATFDVDATMLRSAKPVVAVTAVRTGCGKSAVSRAAARALRAAGRRVAVVRHPMPYGDLEAQAVQRFESLEDVDRADCTIEEREEYEPHVAAGSTVFAGVDYAKILRRAEAEADVILWDGGNNDVPFYRPDLWIALADPLRPGHEVSWFPGSINFERADVVILMKMDSATPEGVATVRANLAARNPRARRLAARMPVTLSPADAARVRGARVLAVEDGPTVTHGGMPTGAATIAARRYGAAKIVDPRPWLAGSLVEVFRQYPDLGPLLPAMGYRPEQVADLERTTNAVECDVVIVGTPIKLDRIARIERPHVFASYDVEFDGPGLDEALAAVLESAGGPEGRRNGKETTE